MNLLKKNFIKFKNSGIQIRREANGLRIVNPTDRHGFALYTGLINTKKMTSIFVRFGGKILEGNGAIFQILRTNRSILSETSFNSTSTYTVNAKSALLSIKIQAHSEVFIDRMDVEFSSTPIDAFDDLFENLLKSDNDLLIITPSYPTEENKYFGGFVHSRVKAYKKSGISFDLICAHEYPNTCNYRFEGIDVTRTNFYGLRRLLTKKKYKTILLHFFDDKYARILDACDLTDTNLYFWVHGPETLYWDWSKMTDPYFVGETPLNGEQQKHFKANDELIARYNSYPNVHWVFVSQWIKNHSEKLIGLSFNNSVVIPNFVDEENFNYVEKDPELRKKIFFVRRFENISKYAIDVNVRTILELSRRDFFSELEFHIYGTGDHYDTIIAPVKDFPNVKLHRKFLTHTEISQVHKQNGIGLFATRYDAQGVSMCEAAMSGLAIVSSQNDAIAEFLPGETGILCDTEDYVAYADLIEKMVRDPEYFSLVSKACHQKVYDKCCFEATIAQEIQMIRSIADYRAPLLKPTQTTADKVLSVIVPCYNVSPYLYHGVCTMLEHKNGHKIQVILVNDGSKDNTLEVAKRLQERFSSDNVVILDKENGGHGSTINEGLKLCTGKYIRCIDGDDWVNTKDFCRLIDVLEIEDSHIVVTDYSEDRAVENQVIPQMLYPFMVPGKQYRLDDLCYEGYGFAQWGPIFATSNFKREVIQDSVRLTEKSFYVDMEFDAFSIAKADSIAYYPLNIYRYFIGRVDQSISEASYKRNFKQHENVIFHLIQFYYSAQISKEKKNYVREKLILPMIVAHYVILIQFLKSKKEYNLFEKKFSQYPEFYHHPNVATRMKRFHRKTKGLFLKREATLKRIAKIVLRKSI